MEKIPMTAEGLERLKEELRRLKTEERPAVVRAIGTAREMGDISENAEYHAAKDHQGFIEARLGELEDKIRRAQVIEVEKLSGKRIQFGATVKLINEDGGKKETYRIVGADEADAAQGLLSIASPLARGLIGKEPGDSVEISTPGGIKAYEIRSVSYK